MKYFPKKRIRTKAITMGSKIIIKMYLGEKEWEDCYRAGWRVVELS